MFNNKRRRVAGAVAGAVAAAIAALARTGEGTRTPAGEAPLGDAARCAAYGGLPAGWGRDAHAGMVRIAGGRYVFGSTRGYAEEGPAREVDVAGFWIDRTEVTNAQFASFVSATGYVTEAERGGGAAVFHVPAAD